MRALLDINMLIALLDPQHIFHDRSHKAWDRLKKDGFATCPLTENGVIRILSNPNYPGSTDFGIIDVIEVLRDLTQNADHQFWPDDISILNKQIFNFENILGSKQLTDIYLLGLAAQNNGVLVSFDRRIIQSAVRLAKDRNLQII